MTEKEWQDEVNQLQYRSSNVIEIERERERERFILWKGQCRAMTWLVCPQECI